MHQTIHLHTTCQVDPDKPCKTVFDDCVLDNYQCSDYFTMDAGCPLMPIGDPVGNRCVSACVSTARNVDFAHRPNPLFPCSSPLEVTMEYTKGTVGPSRALR